MKMRNLVIVLSFLVVMFSFGAATAGPSSKDVTACENANIKSRVEKEFINKIYPLISDPYCCVKVGINNERYDCLLEKHSLIAKLAGWLGQTFNDTVLGMLDICEFGESMPSFPVFNCPSFSYAYPNKISNKDIESAISSVRGCLLGFLKVQVEGYMTEPLELVKDCPKQCSKE